MAIINAFSAAAVEYLNVENVNITDDFYDFTVSNWPPGTLEISPTLISPMTTHWPVEANGLGISVYKAGAYSHDFYYRIIIRPTETDVGNLIGVREIEVKIWNAYFEPKTITSLTPINADGIIVTQGLSLPYELRPLEEVTYILTVTTDGTAVINAEFQWLIEGEIYSSFIYGKRFVVFPFKANFRNTGPVETFEFLTDVKRKKTGSEQRRSLRINPRRNISYDILLDKNKSQLFKNLMWGWQNRSFGVPLWVDISFTTTVTAAATKVINVDTSNRGFRVGDSAILIESATNYEVIEIESFTSSSITSKTELSKTWPKNTEVAPLILGHLPKQQAVSRPVGDYLYGQVRFDTTPNITYSQLPVLPAAVTFDGLEVITEQPNWVRDLDETYEYNFDTLDNQTGPIQWVANELYSGNTRKYSWLLFNRSQINEMRGFIRRRAGRFKPCWVPSWSHDFDLVGVTISSSRVLRVLDNGFRTLVGVTPDHTALVLILKNGNRYYRKITAVAVNVDGVTVDIEVDSVFGFNLNPSDVDYISYLDKCRCSSDTQVFVWQTNEVVVYETNFTSVVD